MSQATAIADAIRYHARTLTAELLGQDRDDVVGTEAAKLINAIADGFALLVEEVDKQ